MVNPRLVPHHGEVIDPHFHFFDLSDCSTSGQDPKVLSDFQVRKKGKFGELGRGKKQQSGSFLWCELYVFMLLKKMHEGSIFVNIYL